MKNKLFKKISIIGPVTSFTVFSLTTHSAYADLVDDAKGGVGEVDDGVSSTSVEDIFQRVTTALLFLIGAVSVIMIIIGGMRFIFSQGDAQATASARNTILYSVIGLVVAVAAYGIISWVLGRIY